MQRAAMGWENEPEKLGKALGIRSQQAMQEQFR
jgi:hypothetical protein